MNVLKDSADLGGFRTTGGDFALGCLGLVAVAAGLDVFDDSTSSDVVVGGVGGVGVGSSGCLFDGAGDGGSDVGILVEIKTGGV